MPLNIQPIKLSSKNHHSHVILPSLTEAAEKPFETPPKIDENNCFLASPDKNIIVSARQSQKMRNKKIGRSCEQVSEVMDVGRAFFSPSAAANAVGRKQQQGHDSLTAFLTAGIKKESNSMS